VILLNKLIIKHLLFYLIIINFLMYNLYMYFKFFLIITQVYTLKKFLHIVLSI